jgi:hypothetical protein
MSLESSHSHLIQILSRGFGCTCGHNRSDAASHHDALRLAAQHQLAAFVKGVAAGKFVTTSCLACKAKMLMPESDSEGLMHDYAEWIGKPCPRCGRSPKEVVAGA